MKNRGVLVLLALGLILGGISIWDIKNETQKEEKQKIESQLVTLKRDQIQEIQVTTSSYTVRLTKGEEGWKIEEPLKDLADQKIVDDLLGLMDEKSTDLVAEGDSIDWKVFGLDQSKGKVQFKNNAGESQEIEVSALQNFEFNAFLRRARENKVFTASSSWQTKIEKKVNDFRNKSLFRHKIANADVVQVQNKSGKYQIEKKADQWSLQEHADWVIDAAKVKEILDSISDAHINDIVAEGKISSSDLRKYNLDKPLAQVFVRSQGTSNDFQWQVRVAKSKDDHYAFIENQTAIYKLDPVSFSNVINSKPDDLRDKSLPFKFKEVEAQKLELSTNLKKFMFEKKGNDWNLTENTEKFKVNAENVKSLLTKVSETKASFYEKPSTTKNEKFDNQLILRDGSDKEVFTLLWSSKLRERDSKKYFLAKTNLFSEPFALEESTISGYPLQQLVEEKK